MQALQQNTTVYVLHRVWRGTYRCLAKDSAEAAGHWGHALALADQQPPQQLPVRAVAAAAGSTAVAAATAAAAALLETGRPACSAVGRPSATACHDSESEAAVASSEHAHEKLMVLAKQLRSVAAAVAGQVRTALP